MKNKFNIEVEGKTVEEAIKKALKELKLKRDEVKIEVLSEEKRGLFGMPGAKPAKIRVSLIKDSTKGSARGGFASGEGSARGGRENT